MRPEKAIIVEDLHTKLNASPFLFITDYTGLRVDQFSELRTRLAGAGARCHVVKNTFLRRAAKDAGLPELGDLKGQTAIIVGDKDVAAAAKIVKIFVAEFQKPIVRLGVIDRAVVSSDQIKAIADLPAREILLATLLGVLQAPASKLVRVLSEPASALARVIQAYADKGGGVAGPAPAAPAPAAETQAPAPEQPAAAAAEAAPAPAAEPAAPAAEAPAPGQA
jgi:large subunit ribosomal protein L10